MAKQKKTKKKQKSKNEISKYLYIIPVLLWMAFIFWMSANNGTESANKSGAITETVITVVEQVRQDTPQEQENLRETLEFIIRKTAHMTEYAILFLLLYLAAMKIEISEKRWYNKSIAVLVSLLYACSDEMHQLFVADRDGKLTDVGIDMIGVLIVLICMAVFRHPKWRIIGGVCIGILLCAAVVYLLLGNFGV